MRSAMWLDAISPSSIWQQHTLYEIWAEDLSQGHWGEHEVYTYDVWQPHTHTYKTTFAHRLTHRSVVTPTFVPSYLPELVIAQAHRWVGTQPSFVLGLICLRPICKPSRGSPSGGWLCVCLCVVGTSNTNAITHACVCTVGLPFSTTTNHWTPSSPFKMASSVCVLIYTMKRIPDEV